MVYIVCKNCSNTYPAIVPKCKYCGSTKFEYGWAGASHFPENKIPKSPCNADAKPPPLADLDNLSSPSEQIYENVRAQWFVIDVNYSDDFALPSNLNAQLETAYHDFKYFRGSATYIHTKGCYHRYDFSEMIRWGGDEACFLRRELIPCKGSVCRIKLPQELGSILDARLAVVHRHGFASGWKYYFYGDRLDDVYGDIKATLNDKECSNKLKISTSWFEPTISSRAVGEISKDGELELRFTLQGRVRFFGALELSVTYNGEEAVVFLCYCKRGGCSCCYDYIQSSPTYVVGRIEHCIKEQLQHDIPRGDQFWEFGGYQLPVSRIKNYVDVLAIGWKMNLRRRLLGEHLEASAQTAGFSDTAAKYGASDASLPDLNAIINARVGAFDRKRKLGASDASLPEFVAKFGASNADISDLNAMISKNKRPPNSGTYVDMSTDLKRNDDAMVADLGENTDEFTRYTILDLISARFDLAEHELMDFSSINSDLHYLMQNKSKGHGNQQFLQDFANCINDSTMKDLLSIFFKSKENITLQFSGIPKGALERHLFGMLSSTVGKKRALNHVKIQNGTCEVIFPAEHARKILSLKNVQMFDSIIEVKEIEVDAYGDTSESMPVQNQSDSNPTQALKSSITQNMLATRCYSMSELIQAKYACNSESEDADFSSLKNDWDLIIQSRELSHGTSRFLKEFASFTCDPDIIQLIFGQKVRTLPNKKSKSDSKKERIKRKPAKVDTKKQTKSRRTKKRTPKSRPTKERTSNGEKIFAADQEAHKDISVDSSMKRQDSSGGDLIPDPHHRRGIPSSALELANVLKEFEVLESDQSNIEDNVSENEPKEVESGLKENLDAAIEEPRVQSDPNISQKKNMKPKNKVRNKIEMHKENGDAIVEKSNTDPDPNTSQQKNKKPKRKAQIRNEIEMQLAILEFEKSRIDELARAFEVEFNIPGLSLEKLLPRLTDSDLDRLGLSIAEKIVFCDHFEIDRGNSPRVQIVARDQANISLKDNAFAMGHGMAQIKKSNNVVQMAESDSESELEDDMAIT